mmetsp:Transcript_4894/g.10503  ORF Transcript_4894/g.10503 Transcript_4894/m.10503 type:complete len:219 (-) Transcript_4894:826-1482(-)
MDCRGSSSTCCQGHCRQRLSLLTFLLPPPAALRLALCLPASGPFSSAHTTACPCSVAAHSAALCAASACMPLLRSSRQTSTWPPYAAPTSADQPFPPATSVRWAPASGPSRSRHTSRWPRSAAMRSASSHLALARAPCCSMTLHTSVLPHAAATRSTTLPAASATPLWTCLWLAGAPRAGARSQRHTLSCPCAAAAHSRRVGRSRFAQSCCRKPKPWS